MGAVAASTPAWRAHAARLRVLAQEGWRYFLASALALAVDFVLLVTLTEFGKLPYLVSAAIGFSAGIVVAYVLSVTLVFRERRFESRRTEFAGFLAIGVLGLGLNQLLLKAFVEDLHLGYALAKVPAAGVGFVFSFVLRRAALFTRSLTTA
jgi:putative flippase GtrA